MTILNSSDMNIYNLETPLADIESPISKTGPNLCAETNTINGIKALNPMVLCLANNHILDQGIPGLKSTMDAIQTAEIEFIGAGENLVSAQKPFLREIHGIRVGIYNCAEHEFTIANDNNGGANPFDIIDSYKHIEKLKPFCDFLIVIYHGGKEYYRYPSPNLQKYCRRFVDCGADLVVCQHSHCIGCAEQYNDSTIVYGQGNFIFDHGENEYRQTGLLINAEISDTKEINIDYLPIIKDKHRIHYGSGVVGEAVLKSFAERSREISEPGFIKKNYIEFSEETLSDFILSCGYAGVTGLFLRIMRKAFGKNIILKLSSEKRILRLLNYLQCEAHHELFVTGLKKHFRMID